MDRIAEQKIVDFIRKSYPDHGIIAEEGGTIDGKDEHIWVIDPLDGTTNFLHGYPHVAVSIGIKYKGVLEHGKGAWADEIESLTAEVVKALK